MTEYKKIESKIIYVIMKSWFGGKIEFSDAYWDEEAARKEAAKQLPVTNNTFTISIHTVNLHGSMIDRA